MEIGKHVPTIIGTASLLGVVGTATYFARETKAIRAELGKLQDNHEKLHAGLKETIPSIHSRVVETRTGIDKRFRIILKRVEQLEEQSEHLEAMEQKLSAVIDLLIKGNTLNRDSVESEFKHIGASNRRSLRDHRGVKPTRRAKQIREESDDESDADDDKYSSEEIETRSLGRQRAGSIRSKSTPARNRGRRHESGDESDDVSRAVAAVSSSNTRGNH